MGQQGEPGLAGYEVRYLIISNQLSASHISTCLHVYDITHQTSLLGLFAFGLVILHNIISYICVCRAIGDHRAPWGLQDQKVKRYTSFTLCVTLVYSSSSSQCIPADIVPS